MASLDLLLCVEQLLKGFFVDLQLAAFEHLFVLASVVVFVDLRLRQIQVLASSAHLLQIGHFGLVDHDVSEKILIARHPGGARSGI